MSALIPYGFQLLSVENLLSNKRTWLFLQGHRWFSSYWTTSCFEPHALSSTVQTPHLHQPPAMISTPSTTIVSITICTWQFLIAFKANRLLCVYPGGAGATPPAAGWQPMRCCWCWGTALCPTFDSSPESCSSCITSRTPPCARSLM